MSYSKNLIVGILYIVLDVSCVNTSIREVKIFVDSSKGPLPDILHAGHNNWSARNHYWKDFRGNPRLLMNMGDLIIQKKFGMGMNIKVFYTFSTFKKTTFFLNGVKTKDKMKTFTYMFICICKTFSKTLVSCWTSKAVFWSPCINTEMVRRV